MRVSAGRGAAARPVAGKLPEVGVSSAVRRAFNAALHPRDGSGRFRQTDNPQQQAQPRRQAADGQQPRRLTVGAKALKTSGVTGKDTIQVLSNRVRKYQGFTTVESFVAAHPKGRAYALRTLAADQKAGRIGFAAAAAEKAPEAPPAALQPAGGKSADHSIPSQIPAEGTAEGRFHNTMREAAAAFGPKASFEAKYYPDGRLAAFSVETGHGEDVIQRSANIYKAESKERSIDHGLFMLDRKVKRPGQAKKFLAKSIEAYKHLDIDRVNLHASMSVGGYAWLKYGFKPDSLSEGDLATKALAKVEKLHASGAISDAAKGHLTRILNHRDFHAAVDFGGSRKIKLGGKNQSLGKHLFLGSDWTGSLDMHSRADMARFHEYVGKDQ